MPLSAVCGGGHALGKGEAADEIALVLYAHAMGDLTHGKLAGTQELLGAADAHAGEEVVGSLAHIQKNHIECAKNRGLWCAEAEKLLLEVKLG